MKVKEWEQLKHGDRVIAKNGPYIQHGIVRSKFRDENGMRWVKYHWFLRGVFQNWASKRYMSLELESNQLDPL